MMADDPSTISTQRLMAWGGVVAMVVLLLGQWVIAGFVPPPSPHNSIAKTVAIYQEDRDRIRIGLIVALFGVTLLAPWSVVISTQMRRIEGSPYPLALLQLVLGVMLVLEFLFPVMMWQAAAYRPTLNPEITYRLHDLGSLTFDGLPMTAALQATSLGVAILRDRQTDPLMPRWLGYLSLWAAIGFLPGALNPLVQSGPLAWNGVLAWWLGLSIFGVWIAAVTWVLLRDALPRR
jgi:hypothetical protein